jgi:hypothetical protein
MALPAVVWPVPASTGTFTESYGFLTDIMAGYNGREQRVALRAVPLETAEFAILAEGREAQLVRSLVYGGHVDVIGVPLWQYGQPLNSQMSIGVTVMSVTTAGIPWQRIGTVGGYVLVHRGAFDYELFEIDVVNPSSIVVLDPAAKTWPIRTRVYPTRLARLPEAPDLRWDTPDVAEGSLAFSMEGV